MAIPHANPGEVVDIRPLGADMAVTVTKTLVKTRSIEILRMVVPAGKEIPTHKAHGEIVVQCLEGKIAFTACGTTNAMEAGHLLYLTAGEPHSLHGIEDSSLLVTILMGNPESARSDA
jgi:quercetin dioxygenase-like cupin family protein